MARVAIALYPFVLILGYPGPGPKLALTVAVVIFLLGSRVQKWIAMVLIVIAGFIIVSDAYREHAGLEPAAPVKP